MNLVRYSLTFILAISFIIGVINSLNAEEIDVATKVKSFKSHFAKTSDVAEICNKLEALDKYLHESISLLNQELANNKQLFAEIEKYGKFENNKVILIKGKNEQLDNYIKYLNDNGIKISFSEGNINLYFDPMYFVLTFKDVLPKDIVQYYEILGEDIEEGFQEDAALTIPWDLLRIKIIRYENYLSKIRNIGCSYIIKSTRAKLHLYLGAYLKGLDNSSINEHIQEAKISFEKFLNDDKSSRFYKLINDYYCELRRNNFKFGRKQETKDNNKYVGWTILDKDNKEVYIDEIADKYLEKANELY